MIFWTESNFTVNLGPTKFVTKNLLKIAQSGHFELRFFEKGLF